MYFIIFSIIACLSLVLPVHANPDDLTDYPYIVDVEVTEIFLLNWLQNVNGYLSDENVHTIFNQIVEHCHMTLDKICMTLSALKSLKSKLGRMWKAWTCKTGGNQRKKLSEKWKLSCYKIKVQHKTGSPTKRSLEKSLEKETMKRRKLESDLDSASNDLERSKHEKLELERRVDRLSNPTKRRQGQRGKTKGKFQYSTSQKYRQKRQKVETAKEILRDLNCLGVKSYTFEFTDQDGEMVTVSLNEDNNFDKVKTMVTEDELDEMIFITDTFNITDNAYHELAQVHKRLPRACNVYKRRHALNESCEIFSLDGEYNGVYKSLQAHLIQNLSDPSKATLLQNDKVRIKFSGDGTRAGVKKHMINVSYTIVDEKTCASERGNYLLAIVQCPETGEDIHKALKILIQEFNALNSVVINGREIRIEKFLGGDLKFLNQVTGIGGFAGLFSCLWCKCPKLDRSDMTKEWSMTDVSKGARTVDEITACSKKPKSNKTRFNCNASPIFPSIPIAKVIPDTLHLVLRMMDQLVYQVTFYLQNCDNIVRLTANLNLQNCTNLMRFQDFIKKLGIHDWRYEIKDSKIQARSFTGPEHRRILTNINLDLLIPDHPKLTQLKTLWMNFKVLVDQLNVNLANDDIDKFELSAKAWVDLYSHVFLAKDVTPYMHVLAYHIPEVMRLYGNPTSFCQQGLEKLNDLVTKWYFRSSNFGKDSFRQIMHKQHRIRLLEEKYKRTLKWRVRCSVCNKQDGHNKRTCPTQFSG